MRKLFLSAAVALTLVLNVGMASACHRGCGHHRHHKSCHTSCAAPACSTCAAPAPCSTGCGSCGAAAAPACGGGCGATCMADGATATVVVQLPGNATLTVDGTATVSTTSSRTFVTPVLESGKDYHYTLTAQVMRDGTLQTVTRQVAVRAGEETRVSLEMPVAEVASR